MEIFTMMKERDNISILPFEDFSRELQTVYSADFGCKVAQYVGCRNSNLIVEGSYRRLMATIKDCDYAILTTLWSEEKKEECILHNRRIRETIISKGLHLYILLGICDEDNTPGRAYLIVRPEGVSESVFRDAVKEYEHTAERKLRFIGVESPGSNSGRMMFALHGIKY